MKVALVLLVVLVGPCMAQSGKATTITKIKNLLTTFATDAQLTKIALDAYNMKTIKDMGDSKHILGLAKSDASSLSGIVNTVMTSLTGNQMVKGMQIYNGLVNDLGGSEKAKQTMNNGIEVAQNNLGPILAQIQNKVKTMKSNGKAQAACLNQEYTMFNTFFTKANCKTILTRFKNKVTAAEWSAIKKNLQDVAKFSLYGF
ncbi:hypothetical protein AAVH_41111 [Aphelenchoides avenae]|nr:hypothetical protein AAVH_41111 [Aphelenchus avenae]